MKAIISKYYLVPLALLCGFYLYKSIGFPIHDFANYYFGGKFTAENRFGSWIYFPYEFNKAIAAQGFRSIFASYAPNTPFLALFFAPFSFLSIGLSKLLLNFLGTGLFFFTLRRLAIFYRIAPAYLWLIPILFFIPIKNGLLFGQVYFLLFFLIGECWIAYRKNKKIKSAWFLSLAVMLKLFPVLLVFAFLFRKKFTLLGYVAGCCLSLLLLSIFFGNVEAWIFFVKTVLPKASNGEIAGAYVQNYQSVLMLLKEMFIGDRTHNPSPLFNQPMVFAALVFAFKIKLIAIGYYISRKVRTPLFTLSFWILCMLLFSPYGSTYGLILLVFPFLCVSKTELRGWQKAIVFLFIFGICNIPIAWICGQIFPFSYTRLLLLLLVLALFCFLVRNVIRLKNVALATAIPAIAFVILHHPKPDNSYSILGKDAPLLIHDYKVSNSRLTYFYWNEKGENAASIAFEGTVEARTLLHNNEVFYNGKQITFDEDNKKKPTALSDKIIYLSDHGRGVGFYDLRVVDVNHRLAVDNSSQTSSKDD